MLIVVHRTAANNFAARVVAVYVHLTSCHVSCSIALTTVSILTIRHGKAPYRHVGISENADEDVCKYFLISFRHLPSFVSFKQTYLCCPYIKKSFTMINEFLLPKRTRDLYVGQHVSETPRAH